MLLDNTIDIEVAKRDDIRRQENVECYSVFKAVTDQNE